jgi:DNA-binding MarR family transcriptional regulator
MSETRAGSDDDKGTCGGGSEEPASGESAARRENAGTGAASPRGDEGAASGRANGEPDPPLSSRFLRTLHRDLNTLSAVVRRTLEQAPLEAVPDAPVTVDQLRVLRYATRNPGLRVGEIAAKLGMKPPSASAALDRLEAKKLVVRRAGREDQRTVYIEPTEASTVLVREVQTRAEAKLAQSLARLETGDVSVLPELVRKLVTAIMKDEALFADVCHHCGPGYDASCPIHRLYGNCPYAEPHRSTSS